jgi:phosphoglycerol transferase MdoB-like AlkP superfamily enzyme
MLLIVLTEAALFVFWSYFVVIFLMVVDVLYRRAIRTSGILPVKIFSQPPVL